MILERLKQGNDEFVRDHFEKAIARLTSEPGYELAIVACMETRMDVESIFSLEPGQAIILRNAGNRITDDVIRSLLVAVYKLGVDHVAVLGHTDCGMTHAGQFLPHLQEELAHRKVDVDRLTRGLPLEKWLEGFKESRQNVSEMVEFLKTHPALYNRVKVYGFLYDVGTGRVSEV